jgi:uncharacterized protein
MSPLGLALGLLVGVALGLLGGGGSILTVPIFVYVVVIEAKPAIAMSLAVVGAASLIGAVSHFRAGNMNPKAILVFAPPAMLGTFIGTHLAALLPSALQLVLFGAVMLGAALMMLRDRKLEPASQTAGQFQLLPVLIAGTVVGLLTGLIGVGGGFLIVPALVLFGGLPMRQAVGTSLAVIALNSLVGFIGNLGRIPMDWALIGAFIFVAGLGIVIGSSLVRRVSAAGLKRGFAVFLVVVGTFILYQNRSAFAQVLPSQTQSR